MIDRIRQLAREDRFRITLHARIEMDKDGVTTDDLVGALTTMESEMIEDYPDDPRGHSHLLLGWPSRGDPLHICCAVHEEEIVIITVYRPDPKLWQAGWRTRR